MAREAAREGVGASRRGATGGRAGYGLLSLATFLAAYALVSNLYRLLDTSELPRTLRLLLRPPSDSYHPQRHSAGHAAKPSVPPGSHDVKTFLSK